MSQTYTIELKRGLFANLPASGSLGEPYFCTDTGQLFIWNGSAMAQISVNIPVTSVFSRTGTITAQSGDYGAFYDVLGAAATAQSNAETFATSQGYVTASTAPVRSVFGRTGIITAQSGDYSYSQISGTPTLPQNEPAVAHNFLTAYNSTTGAFTQAQPSYSDISGTPQLAQSFSPVAGEFLTGYTASTGVFTAATPSYPVISVFGRTGTVTAATNDYSFSQISGSVAASQLPNPSASTLGGVESIAAVAHNFLTGISTSGVPSQAQPAFTDISGTATSAQLPAATNSAQGAIELNTDLGGTATAPQVVSTHLGSPLPVNQGGTGTTSPAIVAGTGVTVSGSWPNQTVNATLNQVVQSGLMAEYRILASETVASLVDYSGNGNGATGTVGTAPTIISGSGGIQCNANGAVSLPSALNSALTIMVVAGFQPSATTQYTSGTPAASIAQALVQGTNSSHAIVMELLALQANNGVTTTASLQTLFGGYRPATLNQTATNNGFNTMTEGCFAGLGSLALTLGASDQWYINGVAIPQTLSSASAGQQTTGNFQLGGCAANTGQTLVSYFQGQIYYVLFYNRALSASEVVANHNVMLNALAARGVNFSPAIATSDTRPQIVTMGDSITAGVGAGGNAPFPVYLGIPLTGLPYTPAIENQGIGGSTAAARYAYGNIDVDSLYRPGAIANVFTYWLGTNDNNQAVTDWGLTRDYLLQRKAKGFKAIPISMISRTTEDAYKDALNPLIRTTWKEYADGFCDMAANPNLGADGAYANTTYFSGDQVHPTQLSYTSVIAPLVNAAIARVYGKRDFSSARTVVAPSGIANTGGATFGVSGFNYASLSIGTVAESEVIYFVAQGNATPTWVNDSLGNQYFNIANTSNGGSVWGTRTIRPGTCFINVFYAGGIPNSIFRGSWAKYSGVGNFGAESVASNNAGSGTTMTGGAVTPAENNCLVLGLGS